MPIADRSYRAYSGQLRRGLAWWVIVQQELRVILPTRSFMVLLGFCLVHVLLRLLQIVACDIIAASPQSPIARLAQELPLTVNKELFYQFLMTQSVLLSGIILYAGAGMICDDIRNNLMEIYFSKPITWVDYALGKIMTLVLLGLALSAVPGILLVILHNILAPGWDTLKESFSCLIDISMFASVIILPCSLIVLAGSALLRNQRDVSITVVVLVIGSLAIPNSLKGVLDSPTMLYFSIPSLVYNIGEHLFSVFPKSIDLPLFQSCVVVALTCLVFLVVICRKIHRCEVEV